MILSLEADLPVVPVGDGIRRVGHADFMALAELMAEAYHGSVDDEGEDAPAALAELHRMESGAYGPALRDAWLVHEDGRGQLWSAVVCTRWQGRPFVAQAFTRPDVQRQGLSGRLVLAAAGVLQRAGESELSLIVTRVNPAMQLYERLGFIETDWPETA